MSKNFYVTIINGFIYKFLIKYSVYFIATLPLAFAIASLPNIQSYIGKVLLLSFSLVVVPFIVIITTGLLIFIHPKQKAGPVETFSKGYFTWLRRNILHEVITSSTFLNNTLNRIDLIKFIYYKLAGLTNPYLVIIAPNVLILDPDRIIWGREIFIGFNSVITGHIIKGNRLLIKPVKLGNCVKIGSGCVISCGVEVGDDTKIDFGVTIGTNSKIGKNVTILRETKIDDNVTIEDGVIIGKFCTIGRKATVQKNAFLKSFETIKPKQLF